MNLYVQWFTIASKDVPNLCIELFNNAPGIESYFMNVEVTTAAVHIILKMKTFTIVVLLAVLLMSEQAVGHSWYERFRDRVQSGLDTASGHVRQAAEEAEAVARQAAERARDAAARARELARQAADGTRNFVRRRIDDLD